MVVFLNSDKETIQLARHLRSEIPTVEIRIERRKRNERRNVSRGADRRVNVTETWEFRARKAGYSV